MSDDLELRREALDRAAKFAAFGEKVAPDAILDLAERIHAFLTAGQPPAGIKLPEPAQTIVIHGQLPGHRNAAGLGLKDPEPEPDLDSTDFEVPIVRSGSKPEVATAQPPAKRPKPEPEKVEQVRVADLLPANKPASQSRGPQGAAVDAKVAELKERPGEWVRIKAVKSSAAKNSWLRRGCEARTRTEADGTMWLYARWPAPARTEPKGPGPKPAAPTPAAPDVAWPELPAPDHKSDAGAPAPDCPPNLIAERKRYEAARRARLNGHRNAR